MQYPTSHTPENMRRNIIFLSLGCGIFALSSFVAAHEAILPDTPTEVAECPPQEPDSLSDIRCCLTLPGAPQHCIDDGLTHLPETLTTQTLIDELTQKRDSDKLIDAGCHVLIHGIGRRAYRVTRRIDDALMHCSPMCDFGCMHGVMESFFFPPDSLGNEIRHLTGEEVTARMPEACLDPPDESLTPLVAYQCYHGLGHAVLSAMDYTSLDEALTACDTLNGQFAADACHAGVFMENILAADQSKRILDPARPLFPCTEVAEPYRKRCFSEQTRALTERRLDADGITKACIEAGAYADWCFDGLGRDSAALVLEEKPEEAAAICEGTPSWTACIRGMLRGLVDTRGSGKEAAGFCAILTEERQSECFSETLSYLRDYYEPDTDLLNALCVSIGNEDAAKRCLDAMPYSFLEMTVRWLGSLLSQPSN
jgi:hypothetical protein